MIRGRRDILIALSLLLILVFRPHAAYALDAWVLTPTATFSGTVVDYSYNPIPAANTVLHLDTGTYQVRMYGIYPTDGGNVQVVAFGNDNARCQVVDWGRISTDDLLVNVRCHTPSGSRTNSRFVAWYVFGDSITPELAYAWADAPSSASYTPNLTYQYNSHSGNITIARSGTGIYTVSVPNFAASTSNVVMHVTSYGSDGSYCNIQNAGVAGTTRLVFVRCYNEAGNLSDKSFSIRLNRGDDGSSPIAYAFADDTVSASYTPTSSYQYSITGSSNTAVNFSGTGDSAIIYTGLPEVVPSTAMVTAVSSKANYCKLTGWGGDPVEVDTTCFNSSGAESLTPYEQSYQALTSCLVGPFDTGVTGGGSPACIEDDLLSYSEICYLECAADYHSPSGPGTGSYECSYGELDYTDPSCELHAIWVTGAWSSCVSNTQTRTVQCQTVDTNTVVADTFCDSGTRPPDSVGCGGQYCESSTGSATAGLIAACIYEYSGGPLLGCVSSFCTDEVAGGTLHQPGCVNQPVGGTNFFVFTTETTVYCGSVWMDGYCAGAVATDGRSGSACYPP